MLGLIPARAVDYHVATAQQLQNALTLAAANGANNNIYITNGYYTGNFNYNSSAGYNLVITNEPGVTNTQITLDGAGGGRALNITSSGTGAITVAGIIFSRNCGSTSIGALRIAGGTGSVILVSSCQFLSPTNTSGMGLEIASGQSASIVNCTAIGRATSGSGGCGMSISVTASVIVQNCLISTNQAQLNPQSGGVYIAQAGSVTISNSTFSSNTGDNSGGGVSTSAGNVTVFGSIFTGNRGSEGGGVYFYTSGGIVKVIGNNFTGNSAIMGSGAFCAGSIVTLSNNVFSSNFGQAYYGEDYGGGAYCSAGTNIIINNQFSANSVADSGGGIYCPLGTVTLFGNTFTGNSTTGNGGGASFINTTFGPNGNNTLIGNSANGNGGGFYISGGTTNTVSGETFEQNTAASGGGIYVSSPTINLFDNLVAKNSSSSQGAGIWVNASSNLFLINNTITANTSSGTGGGVAFQVSGVVELLNVYNNIIWGNTATGSGGDVYLTGTGKKKVFDFNDADSMYGVWDIAVNNIDLSPQFFDPVNGDYHTQSTSPCANAGTNGVPSQPLTDLDGNSRTNSAGQVDMGCYEFNTTATHPADTNADFVITAAEFNAYAAAWQNGQTWTNGSNPGPNPIPANYVTRAGYLMTNGGAYYNAGSARPVNWKLIGH